MTWRILIVDDEPLARLRLRQLLTELAPSLQRATEAGPLDILEAGDAASAWAALQGAQGGDDLSDTSAIDAVFLDIRMPGSDGLTLAQRLRHAASHKTQPPVAVVFVTAHAEHALGAFDVAALDYLTKPVRRDRLVQALERVLTVVLAQRAGAPAGSALTAVPSSAAPRESADRFPLEDGPIIVVQDRGGVVRVPVAEVLYLKAEQKYVTVRTANAAWLTDDSLAELEPLLGPRFLRVHRNALVALAAIRRLEWRAEEGDGAETSDADSTVMGGLSAPESWAVQVMPTGEWLSVSRRQVAAVRASLARG